MFSAWIGTRHVVTFMLFLGMANAYIMRTNMSVAIVAMVNHTAIEDSDTSEEAVDDECDAFLGNVSICMFSYKKVTFTVKLLAKKIIFLSLTHN